MTVSAAQAQQKSTVSAGDHPARKLVRIGFWFIRHLLILIVVMLAPLVVYELVSLTSFRDEPLLLMAGSISWPLYGAWLCLKIGHGRLRFILLQLLIVLSFIALMAFLASCAASGALMGFVRGFPVLLALAPLPTVLKPALRHSVAFRRHWLVASLTALPVALGFAVLMTYASHMCELAGMQG